MTGPTEDSPPDTTTRALFSVTLLLSALLLFMVQPMYTRLALPHLGGAPIVWSAATVVFQTLLLLGYAAAGWLAPRMTPGALGAAHTALLVFTALVILPLQPPTSVVGAVTIPDLLAAFTFGVGLPYITLTVTSPLLQHWFARSTDPRAHDPYFLYSASNLGSLLALLAYPVAIEPWIGLGTQTRAWQAAYLVLAGLIAASAWRLRDAPPLPVQASLPVDPARAAQWTALAALPSGLIVAQTTLLSTDLTPTPFLWILPLAVYMFTWILAFSRHAPDAEDLERLLPLGVAIGLVGPTIGRTTSIAVPVITTLIAAFMVALAFHVRLRDLRPPPQQLGLFYFCTSLGGVLGSTLTGLVAPLVLSGPWEFYMVLALASVGTLGGAGARAGWTAASVVAAGAGWAFAHGLHAMGDVQVVVGRMLVLGAGAIVVARAGGRPLHAALASGVITGVTLVEAASGELLFRDRSLLGAYRVTLDEGSYRFYHGTTIHGLARAGESGRPATTAYYYEGSPISQAIQAARRVKGGPVRLASVGLGVGTMACLRQADERWDYYEIDQLVVDIARNDQWFRFMSACDPSAEVVIGDARQTLTAGPAAPTWDVIVLDAFSSDAIPSHLLTVEALRAYVQRLPPDGMIVVHITNRHMDLSGPLSATAAELGLQAALRFAPQTGEDIGIRLRAPSRVMALTRDAARLAALRELGWETHTAPPGTDAWTDDRTDLLTPLLFH